ncbi:MAG: dihydroorotate dehydrogenase-like protein [Chloroflexi bacterium]|nr:dihydroorotate dehydrogenase-like protein [Chloroflexota bacterium]
MDLSTTYLGLKLKNPLVPSSSPLMQNLGNLRQMEDAGASAVVMHSLFEEQVRQESHTLNEYLTHGAESSAEALSYFPDAAEYQMDPDAYLEHIQRAKQALDIPVIASLNGVSAGWWMEYAKTIEQAGANALELNIYYLPTDIEMSNNDVEQLYLDALNVVKSSISIPVAMKLSPYFSSIGNMAKQLTEAGADGLVMFNRFYQPDLNLEELEVVPNLQLSSSTELRLPLRWIAILYGRVPTDLALTTGIHTVMDVLKGVAAGAAVTMLASELLSNGIPRLMVLRSGIDAWLTEHEYESLAQLQGSMSHINCAEPAAFERANYMRVLRSFTPPYLRYTTAYGIAG